MVDVIEIPLSLQLPSTSVRMVLQQPFIQFEDPPREPFRWNTTARMNLKKLDIGVEFKMVPGEEQKLSPDHPTIKAMQESVRQLGLEITIEDDKVPE